MKKILFSVLMVLAVTMGLLAQPTLTVGTVTGTPGNIVNVPVIISGCDLNTGGTPLTAMQFFIDYNDNNVVSYVGLTNFYAGMPAGDWVYSGNLGMMAANWAEPTYTQALSIPDGTVLFEMQFAPNAGGTGPLTFIGENQMYDVNYSLIPSSVFNSGSVTVSPAAAVSVWNGTGNWTTVANWSNGIPGGVTAATIQSGTVTVNVPSFAGILTVEANAALTLNSLISLEVSGFVLNSSANNNATGSYINNGGILTVTGNSSVKRWLSGGEHHIISNPLRNTVELSSILYPGNPGWIYRYNEPTAAWVNMWELLEDMFVSYGYLLNYTNDQMLSFNSTNADPFNVNATVAPTVTFTANNGWNLVGNPFPSAINWLGTGWTKTNLDNAIYFYNGTGYSSFVNGTGTNGGTQYIPAAQGYFVKANAANPRLTMPKASAVHNNQQYYKDQVSNVLRLTLTGSGYNDETIIRFDNNATSSFDSEFDAYKLMSMNTEVGQIFSTGDADYSINALPEVASGVEVPVSVMIGAEGTYSINASDLDTFGSNIAIYLEDKETNTMVDLRETPVYTFVAAAGSDDRFKVLFNTSAGIEDPASNGFVYSSGKNIFISNLNGVAEVYNLNGQLIASEKVAEGTLNTISLPTASTGVYVVKVINGGSCDVSKIYVK
ncbi:MAG: T9SS type A sorting domain-containing protein [Bacteroidales bacterium]|nr:T9SS type A sorting domain-containing protein [Bacteroidales bacterium]